MNLRVFVGVTAFAAAVAGPALADTCSWLEAPVAQNASKFIQKGDTIQEYCLPCGEKKAKKTVVSALEIVVAPSGSPSKVNVNGKTLDIAYAYVMSDKRKKTWTNLAHLSKCADYDKDSGPITLPSNLIDN